MTATRTLESDRFEVKGPSGQVYTVFERTEQIDVTIIDNVLRQWEDVSKSYILSGGGSVSRIDDNTFVIVATGETVNRF